MKADSTVQKQLRALRRDCIDQDTDDLVSRVAYAIECAIRWAREDTVGWESPSELARLTARMIRAGARKQ